MCWWSMWLPCNYKHLFHDSLTRFRTPVFQNHQCWVHWSQKKSLTKINLALSYRPRCFNSSNEAVPTQHLITYCISCMLQGSQVLSYIRQATDTAPSPNPVMPGMDFLINLYSLSLSRFLCLPLSLTVSNVQYSMPHGGSSIDKSPFPYISIQQKCSTVDGVIFTPQLSGSYWECDDRWALCFSSTAPNFIVCVYSHRT